MKNLLAFQFNLHVSSASAALRSHNRHAFAFFNVGQFLPALGTGKEMGFLCPLIAVNANECFQCHTTIFLPNPPQT